MSDFFEPWRVEWSTNDLVIVNALNRVILVLSLANLDQARRIVACMNALNGISTDSILRMDPLGWGHIIASVFEQIRQEGGEERVIEYEVEGHPWASEEGCAPCVAGLDDVFTRKARRVTHEQAAAEAGLR